MVVDYLDREGCSLISFQKEDGIISTTVGGPIYPSHYNSWLLCLNYHLTNQPEIMRSLPWIRDEFGKIPFLPAGTLLPGAIMDDNLAREIGISLPPGVANPVVWNPPKSLALPPSVAQQQQAVTGEDGSQHSRRSVEFDPYALYERERREAEYAITQAIGTQ